MTLYFAKKKKKKKKKFTLKLETNAVRVGVVSFINYYILPEYVSFKGLQFVFEAPSFVHKQTILSCVWSAL